MIAFFVARDDHAGIGKLAQKIIARFGNLAGASSAEPHVKVDGFHLALEPCRISVITLRQRHGFRDGDFRASVGIGWTSRTSMQLLLAQLSPIRREFLQFQYLSRCIRA